jgi:hypothetical protein
MSGSCEKKASEQAFIACREDSRRTILLGLPDFMLARDIRI